MKDLQELQREIEIVRKELNIVAEKGLRTLECRQTSARLDKLIEDYMHTRKRNFT